MKKCSMAFFMTLLVLHNVFAEGNRVRKLELQNDQIAEIKTALGIATIIQVPDVPNSVVVGDSEAFKVEYLDQAITIKPLHVGAKSNLYIYTDYRRYNVQLVSVAQAEANFIVYLEPAKSFQKKEKPILIVEPHLAGIRWWKMSGALKNIELRLELQRVGLSSNDVVLFEFLITSQKITEIDPSNIVLKQNEKLVTIQNLFLSNLKIDSGKPVIGTIEVLKSDLKLSSAIRFEMNRTRSSYLTIQEVTSWAKLRQSL